MKRQWKGLALKRDKIILGIDPGSSVTGYSLISIQDGKNSLVRYGTIRIPAKIDLSQKLKKIYDSVLEIIHQHKPDEMAIEEAFYSKNVKSTMVIGQARGAAILAAGQAGIPVTEYSPREIKLSIVGLGNASKSQVQYMVKNLLNLAEPPQPEDAADALAIALCHAHKIDGRNRLKAIRG
ncbi:MAG: crossover junction endodeoxyribonuclease RuvC [candidate division Zixibacteria bacterium]|nr:crossover junction endodeoxyribonuclease RuvC [candidate division Zixibacteria bacterium]